MLRKKTFTLLLVLILFIPLQAFADAGLPMLFVLAPPLGLMLLPVIVLESFILNQIVGDFRKSLKISSVTNLVSSILGIPLTWMIILLFQMVTGIAELASTEHNLKGLLTTSLFQMAWLYPSDEPPNKFESWVIGFSSIFLILFFFLSSWGIEYFLGRKFLKNMDKATVKKQFFKANVLSYLVLTAVVLGTIYVQAR